MSQIPFRSGYTQGREDRPYWLLVGQGHDRLPTTAGDVEIAALEFQIAQKVEGLLGVSAAKHFVDQAPEGDWIAVRTPLGKPFARPGIDTLTIEPQDLLRKLRQPGVNESAERDEMK